MKAAIIVCALTTVALAAPRYQRTGRLDGKLSEHVRTAEQAWTAAEREPDAAKQPALWEQAAGAFAQIDGDPVDTKVKRDAAYAAILAWKNALAVDPRIKPAPSEGKAATGKPVPIPDRDLKLLAAIDRYVKYADPADPELPPLLFYKARTYWRFEHLELAIPLFRTIIDRYPQHDTAEYAAQLVLDSYNRLQQYDRLVAFANELSKNASFLRDRDDLAATVAAILRQAGRKRAEQLEAAARAEHDDEKYVAAGSAYLDLFNANPQDPSGDELLYNAGISFEQGHAMGAAIQAFRLLEKYAPRSKLLPRTIGRLGMLYASIAMYDKAAELLEQYATRYAGEQDAYRALSDAVYYRKAIGDRDKAIADTELFIKNFGARRPREAADAMWSLTALFDKEPDRAIAQLRSYLRSYGAKGGPERVVIAYAKIGQLLWKQSCPAPGSAGLCVKLESHARTCGMGTVPVMTPIPRDPVKAKAALAAFSDASRELERTALTDPAARYYYAQAKLAVADGELETFLGLALPTGLDFDTAAARSGSAKRFGDWVAQKQKAGASAMQKYEGIFSIKDIATTIAAAARIGVVGQSFASTLHTGRSNSAGNKPAFCEAMTSVADPLEATAVSSFAVCLVKSTELGWFDDSSRFCETELARLRPAEFPPAIELRSRPQAVGSILDVEPPLPAGR